MKPTDGWKSLLSLAFCGWLCFAGFTAQAEPIPGLAAIPEKISSEQKARLARQKELLDQELLQLQAAGAAFNAKAAEAQTDQEYDALQAQRAQYIQAATSFNQAVDASVVDARNVPSGLPAALDRAIAGAYGNAPPGVSDRVRKGFQAVMTRDWPVAVAWFQDALNHDPGNLGLRSLVALAQSTPPWPTPPVASGTAEELAALEASEERLAEEDLNRALDDFYRNYLPKHPELQVAPPVPAAPADWRQKIIQLFAPRRPEFKPTGVSAPRG